MAKHQTFTDLMNAGKTWAAIVGVLVYFTYDSMRVLVGMVASLIFWIVIAIYLYWDYKKTHKKSIPKSSRDFHPLTPQTTKESKSTTGFRRKLIIIKNILFIVLGMGEAIFFISLLRYWEIVTIPVGESSIPILTYQNTALIGFFILGIFLAVNVVTTLRHPRKAIFE